MLGKAFKVLGEAFRPPMARAGAQNVWRTQCHVPYWLMQRSF